MNCKYIIPNIRETSDEANKTLHFLQQQIYFISEHINITSSLLHNKSNNDKSKAFHILLCQIH